MKKFLPFLIFILLIGCADQGEVGVTVSLPSTTTTFVDHSPATYPSTTTTSTTVLAIKKKTPTRASSPAIVTRVEVRNVWDVIAQCEAKGNWGARGHYEGGLQFAPSTWTDYVAEGRPYGLVGFPAHAYDASREQQITVAIRVRDGVAGSSDPFLNAQGWNAWPTCRYEAGV